MVGTQKGGTTTVHHLLGQHPDVWTSLPKETGFFFFPPPRRFTPDRLDHGVYHRFFAGWTGERAVGEAYPGYMAVPWVAPRLQAYNPDMRIICILRDPASRAYSHYNMLAGDGAERLSFSEALAAERLRLFGPANPEVTPSDRTLPVYAYANRGLYMAQLKRILEYFPRSQVLVTRNEDLRDDMPRVMRVLYEFIGVDPTFVPQPVRLLEGRYTGEMSPADHAFLRDFHREDTEELERFLGWDLSAWKAPWKPRAAAGGGAA